MRDRKSTTNPEKMHCIKVRIWFACHLVKYVPDPRWANQKFGWHRLAICPCGTQITINQLQIHLISTHYVYKANLYTEFQPLDHYGQDQRAVKGCQGWDCRSAQSWNVLKDQQQKAWWEVQRATASLIIWKVKKYKNKHQLASACMGWGRKSLCFCLLGLPTAVHHHMITVFII